MSRVSILSGLAWIISSRFFRFCFRLVLCGRFPAPVSLGLGSRLRSVLFSVNCLRSFTQTPVIGSVEWILLSCGHRCGLVLIGLMAPQRLQARGDTRFVCV